MPRILAAAFIAVLFLPASAASPDQVLQAYKAASGGAAWKDKAALESDFDISAYGMTGTVHTLTDLKSGRSVTTYKLGQVAGGNGYDGRNAWEMDGSGTVTIQEGGDSTELAVNQAYRDSNGWWRPAHGGAKITASEKTEGGKIFDVLNVTPPGGKLFDVWFARDSHLPVRIVEPQGPRISTTRLSDYATFDGIQLPQQSLSDNSTGPDSQQTLKLTKAQFVAAPPDTAFAPPKSDRKDFEIAGGAAQTVLPIRIINNHIFGEVMINGKGPFTAVFDTGGANLVTPPLAEKLGIKIEGNIPGTGAGEGVMMGGFSHVDRIDIAGASVKNQTVLVMPLDKFEVIEGVPMPAMIGNETFRRFVTRIDYGASTITLIAPDKFDPKDAGVEIPFTFYENHPEVEGTFEGLPAKFDIDTGARDDLTLNKPFVERNNLRAKHSKGIDAVAGWGVGGPVTGYVTRGGPITIGPVKVDDLIVTLSDQGKGAFAGDEYQGNLGGGVLHRFVVTFDYGRRKMYLKPLAAMPADVGSYDRSGLWLIGAPEGAHIVAVIKGSPADQAGLRKDEIIVAVDGTKAATNTLVDIRAKLRFSKPGTVVRLDVLRAGKPEQVRITLRDLL
jgi:hypothetical protein